MEPVEEGHYYHIYNRGAGKSTLFWINEDYKHFIKKYFYYLYIPVETFAYCLLKNHFHFLIRVRMAEEQTSIFDSIQENYLTGSFYGDHFEKPKPFHASRQFSHLMNSYTRHVNSKMNRSGTLIESSFKRKKITDETYLNHVICYIHRNPVHHRITQSYNGYSYSSYREILDETNPFLEAKTVYRQFGGRQNFMEAHKEFKKKLSEVYYLE